jgi:hypothetical protein
VRLTLPLPFVALTAIASLLIAPLVLADALVTTRAMKASTIAEIFVEEDGIRVEIEVGGQDIEVFRNLLPDQVLEKLTGQVIPLEQRQQKFVEHDWPCYADGRKLDGQVDSIELGKRIVRDEITGEPLPNQSEDAEIVLRAVMRYHWQTRPKTVSIFQPQVDDADNGRPLQANIGFVAYHLGVAVNDFRYLSKEQTLKLDWSDPWYTAFEQKTLRRRYFAPAAAFIYVENFEVRKEIVFRPNDLQQWVDLGLAGKSTIEPTEREEICRKAAAFLDEHTPVTIDNKPVPGRLDRVNFIERSLRTASVIPTDQDLDIQRAMIGAIFVYPTEGLPDTVAMEWDLFNDRISQIPTVATDQAGGLPGMLEPGHPLLIWENYLKNPTIPAFLEVIPPARPRVLSISVISIVCLVIIPCLWLRQRSNDQTDSQGDSRLFVMTLILLAIATAANFWPKLKLDVPLERRQLVSDPAGGAITYSLLHNVYRAFDYRDEGTIYDVLNRSASGDLLTQIYLATRKSLTLESQGGARVKVQQVEMASCRVRSIDHGSFVANCNWTVTGSVGHWGHVHQRTNQYSGQFKVQAIDDQWKLTEMELLSEERL